MTITRREAMKHGGKTVAVAAVLPFLASINSAQAQENADAAFLARVAQWHRAYEKFLGAGRFLEACPGSLDEFYARGYGNALERHRVIQKELSKSRPETLAGAVALLGCVERVAVDHERCRAGEGVPNDVFWVRTEMLSKNAYAALRRLAARAS